MNIEAEFLTENMAKSYADAVKEKFDCEVSLDKADVSYEMPTAAYDSSKEKNYATYNEMDERISYVYEHIDYKFKYLREEMSYMMQVFQNHMKGHLPKVKSNEQLKKAIKALGLEEEYEVYKPQISVANKKTGEILVG